MINAFRLYLGFKEFIVRTDCEAICKYYNKVNSKKSSTRRWVLFEDIIAGNGYKVIFEHIKGKDNHSVRQPAPAPAQQYFSLTPLQPAAPAPASLTVFFSHTIPAPVSSSSLPNAVNTFPDIFLRSSVLQE